MLRFLQIKIPIIFLMVSCSYPTTQGLRKVSSESMKIQNTYFSDPKSDYVYKAQIEAYGRNFGGILIIKKINEKHHRLVMTTEFGSKLFDFEFKNEEFIKNSMISELDRKFILKVLRNDFQILLKENILAVNKLESEKYDIFGTKNQSQTNFYFFSKESGFLKQIINSSKVREKIEYKFISESGKAAEEIFIKHNNIKLKIELKKIN